MNFINLKIANLNIGDKYPVRTMGIINLSKESFYKGSVVTQDNLIDTVRLMEDEGAEFLDVGARSTAPGVESISIKEEEERLIPALKRILDITKCLISIDTQYSSVAEKALSLGAHLINDISGLKTDLKLVKVISNYNCPVILMATKKVPGDCHTIPEIINELKNSINIAKSNGIDTNNIIIDPGIGRWVNSKTYEYNLQIIKSLESLRTLQKVILVGISRKSFIGDVLNIPDPANRLNGSLAATVIAVYNGAHIIRTHDVGAQIEMVKMAKALRMSK
ncbi:MAG: dihydropteroate synthase [Candidatus Hodarchaeota archaeon]